MARHATLSRRDALRQSAAAISAFGLGAATGTRHVDANVLGANTVVRVGVIGTGVRGKYLIGNLPKTARVKAICDCATSRMAGTLEPNNQFAGVLASFSERDARRCATYQDYRRMLDREKLDAVIIATPDHHHAQAAMLALDAGLDVYLEKPLAVTIREGRRLVDKVTETRRVLQVGSQQRTMEMNRFACEFVRDGGLGKIFRVELPNYPGPINRPDLPSEPIPGGLDWNLFVGPAPMRPYNHRLWVKDEFKVDELLWRGWDLFRDYSGHIMTNWGAHAIDMMQYALGRDNSGPVAVEAIEPATLLQMNEMHNYWAHKTPPPVGLGERRFWPVTMRYADEVEVTFLRGNDPMKIYGELGSIKINNHRQSRWYEEGP